MRENTTKKKLSTSKKVLYIMIGLCVEIIVFCEVMMAITLDTSSIYALIGIPAALSPIIWGYYAKSKAENTKGGIVYDSATHSSDCGADDENGAG